MSASTPRPRYLLAYIAGAGHCGSTLLNLLLNAHSRILGLSEVDSIRDHLGRQPSSVLQEPFWQAVARRYADTYGSNFADLDLSALPARQVLFSNRTSVEAWSRPNRRLLDSVALEAGARVLVDASKSWQRLALLSKSGAFDLRVIHLLRDGRAVYNSYRRKYERPLFALTKWPKFTLAARRLEGGFPRSNWLNLRYEDLAADPAAALRRVCEFLGVEFEPGMLEYRSASNLGLGGNRMAAGSDQTIALDERWRTELTPARRAAFALLFGWLNRRLGYK